MIGVILGSRYLEGTRAGMGTVLLPAYLQKNNAGKRTVPMPDPCLLYPQRV